MRQRVCLALLPLATAAASLEGQGLAKQITANDGLVQVIYPSRPNVCGDGREYVRTSRGRGQDQMFVGSNTFYGRDGSNRPCVAGPARALMMVISGEITRISTYVGPVPRDDANVRTLMASAIDAVVVLTELAGRAPGRVSSQAIQALMFADAAPPWPALLRIARDDARPRETRQSATTWLAQAVTDHLGISDADESSDDDQMRTQAVFALSQQRKSESVPELIELARSAKYASARKAAIFWLGQSGDRRAIEVYADLLGLR